MRIKHTLNRQTQAAPARKLAGAACCLFIAEEKLGAKPYSLPPPLVRGFSSL